VAVLAVVTQQSIQLVLVVAVAVDTALEHRRYQLQAHIR
jgi:hypothetical protein